MCRLAFLSRTAHAFRLCFRKEQGLFLYSTLLALPLLLRPGGYHVPPFYDLSSGP